MATEENLSSSLHEDRVFHPPPEFASQAQVKSIEEYRELYERSIADPEAFWAEAAQALDWFQPWTKVLEWNEPWARWFVGGKLNLCHNCVDRHAKGARADKTAIIWESEPGEIHRLTYRQLLAGVERFASGLKSLGISKGDCVAIYMGMCPELAMALLACARIGAVHSVIFGGFAAQALVDRIQDAPGRRRPHPGWIASPRRRGQAQGHGG